MSIRNAAPAFPCSIDDAHTGINKREWFAIFAPAPSDADIDSEYQRDRLANPHNDHYKPRIRSKNEIIADLRYRFADAMISRGES